jgi:hypothetical protein
MEGSMSVVKIVVALVFAASVLLAAQARQNRTQTPGLTASDYAAIQQLYARYSHGVDSGAGGGALFTSAFTADGALISPTATIEGTQKLAELATRGTKGPTNVRHFATNIMIEPSPEGAVGSAYVLLVNVGSGNAPSTVTGGGVYHDVFVKGRDGWRIKKRTYHPANSVPAGEGRPVPPR